MDIKSNKSLWAKMKIFLPLKTTLILFAIIACVQAAFAFPDIISVTPSTGPTAGGTTHIIAGSGFTPGPPSVQIDGNNCPISSFSNTQISFLLPPGVGFNKSLAVTVAGVTDTTLFSYKAPTISTFSPSFSGTPGGQTMTISGSNFGPLSTPVTVKIGGVVATGAHVTTAHLAIECTIPAGVGTSKDVAVTVAGQTGIGVGKFNYNPPIIDPVASIGTPGGAIVISGNNFGPVGGPVILTLDGVILPDAAVTVAHTKIEATIPPGSGRNLNLKVQVGGQFDVANFSYSAPGVMAIFPTSAGTAGGDVITISGSNFGPINTPISVQIGSAFSPSAEVTTAHDAIEATIPPGVGANQPVIVTVDGQAANSVQFDYNPPTISEISPRFVPSAGGTTISITGQSLGGAFGQNVVIFGNPSLVKSATHTQIVAQVPPGSGANQPVQVTVAGQTSNPLLDLVYCPYTELQSIGAGDPPPTIFTGPDVTVDYAPGVTAGNTIVTVNLGASQALSNIGNPAISDLYWRIESDSSFNSAEISFHYDQALLGDLRESDMKLYSAPDPAGPWSEVSNQSLDTANDMVTGEVTHFSYFALAGAMVPVTLSEFSLE